MLLDSHKLNGEHKVICSEPVELVYITAKGEKKAKKSMRYSLISLPEHHNRL